MNVVRCKNLHYFDGDKYGKCPHCGEGIGPEASKPEVNEEKKGIWNKGKKVEEAPTPAEKVVEDVKTEAAQFTKEASLNDNPTVDFWQAKPVAEEMEASIESVAEKESAKEESNEEVKEEIKEQVAESQISLKEAVRNASASNEGKTMSYFSSATSAAVSANSTTATEMSVNKIPSEPVVGWLVCTKGGHFGETFSIYSGKNSIGRNTDNRIAITDDNCISRSKHAFIVYEPKKRNFYIQPGDSSGLTYLNDEYITETKMLAPKAVIELGDSTFIFVPLCGQDFSWEDYI